MQDRITVLKDFLKDEPDDEFILYALALEYVKITDFPEADRLFSILLADHSDYLPAYYHAGKLKETLGNKEQAAAIYRKGMLVAERKMDRNALKELKAALEMQQ